MFDKTGSARLFGLPPGVEFPKGLIAGLMRRLEGQPPDAIARVEIYVNTRRMQRRLKSLFDEGPAMLLPRIRLVTDLAADMRFADIPPPAPVLRRRLELTQLVGGLLDAEPDLAPRAALFDLADSLAGLMDEMQGEGVAPEVIRRLDVSDVSGHWQRSLRFVTLAERYFTAESGHGPDTEARQRLVVERLAGIWDKAPPEHPVLVAGSTGSRGATALFMRAVARLPQGAVVLPGVDFDMPGQVWERLDTALTAEDHPQYRFARICRDLGISPADIQPWDVSLIPQNPPRNRLVSLALRPAPVTDQWLTEGKALCDLDAATEQMTLIEAPSSRAEAAAVALVLRQAAEQGRSAALITPDRTLTRQVTAALDRWGIVPDDSAGRPLPLSAPGRFLRHVAGLFGQPLTGQALLTLLKHPLAATGAEDRGAHLLHTRELELRLRRRGPPFPGAGDLLGWAEKGDEARRDWAEWLAGLIAGSDAGGEHSLAAHLDRHIRLAEGLTAGPGQNGSGALWLEAAGIEAARQVDELRREAHHGGDLSSADYASLFHGVLQRGEVREPVTAHPGIMIWGTLEARVQGAELVVLAGLNEGVWPEPPKPDPWLNRALRDRAGLLLPERRIGLSAHDFQQAVAAGDVVLSRSVRDAEAQTVPSRWVNRLCNLLGGLQGEGAASLGAMQRRGERWLAMAEQLDAPLARIPPAPRPAPQPPVEARPSEISITEVQRLIRDPYAVYARRILGLGPLDPLHHRPDAPLRGTIVHRIVELFIAEGPVRHVKTGCARLMAIADEVLQAEAAWPAARRLWRAQLAAVAEWFVAGESARQSQAQPLALEQKAEMELPLTGVTLRGKIDRVDLRSDGTLAIYDYKTGAPPSKDQQEHFDKQLLLSALLAEQGELKGVATMPVGETSFIGLGTSPKFDPVTLEAGEVAEVLQGLEKLLGAYLTRGKGYVSRRAVARLGYGGDYDHLARHGEWDESDDPTPEEVG